MLQNDVLTIQVPSKFFYEWLEEHYVHVLKKAISAELGEKGRLEYSITVEAEHKSPKPFLKNLNVSPVSNGKYQNFQEKKGYDPKGLDRGSFNSQLNPQYGFDNFIEGDCNRLARSAGMAVANKPGVTAFNPLIVYGGWGFGKSHLIQAIGNQITKMHPSKNVLFVTSDRFSNQLIEALKNNNIQEFNSIYAHVDVLILDDVQFFEGKEKTQEIFFQIFNHLHQSGKQVIMASDRAPKDLKGMQERLLSRFKWGLTADIQLPDFETRMAIIQKKLENEGVEIPQDVAEYIAYSIDTNIRELEGVLVSLIAQSSLNQKAIDLELAKQTLKNIVQDIQCEVSIDYIQKFVAEHFNVTIEAMKDKTRKREIVVARQVAMYLAKNYTNLSLKSIGFHFGNRDHSTVIHALTSVNDLMDTDRKFKATMEELLKKLKLKNV
jgi:chromosomal replication initiator protein